MGVRAIALLIALLLLPATAQAAEPIRGLLQASFALNVEAPSVGFRLHPRAGFRIWRATHPAEGTFELGVFGGWSHRPLAFRDPLFSESIRFEGGGAHHALVLASVGHGATARTPEGHLFQFGLYLVGGLAHRSDDARIVDERYGVDSSWSESVQGPVGGTLTSIALLFDGRAGPSFEASWLYGASRGLACWHLGLGLAVRTGPELTSP